MFWNSKVFNCQNHWEIDDVHKVEMSFVPNGVESTESCVGSRLTSLNPWCVHDGRHEAEGSIDDALEVNVCFGSFLLSLYQGLYVHYGHEFPRPR